MMLRLGTVSELDKSTWCARVQFEDAGIISGWLKVIKSVPKKTETADGHSHEITSYFPSVGDAVLCVYADGSNADGYILGGL